jgi:two-component sensor histidine kinase
MLMKLNGFSFPAVICVFLVALALNVNATPVFQRNDSLAVLRYLTLSEKSKDGKKALAYATNGLVIAKRINSNDLMAKAYCQLSYLYRQERKGLVFIYDSLYLFYAKAAGNRDLQFDALQLTIKDYLNVNKSAHSEKYIAYLDTLIADSKNENQLCVNEQVRSFYYTKKFKPREALTHALASLKHAEQGDNPTLKGRSLLHIGDSYAYLFKNDSAATYYFDALKLFNTLDDKYELGNCYNSLGFVYQSSANLPAALNNYRNAKAEYIKAEFPIDAAYIDLAIAEIFLTQKKTDSAGMVIKEAARQFEKYKFDQGRAISYLYLSRYYKLINNQDSASYYKEISNQKFTKENNSLLDFFSIGHNAIMEIQQGNIAKGEAMARELTGQMPGIFPSQVLESAAKKVVVKKELEARQNDYTLNILTGDTADLTFSNTLINPFTGADVTLDSILSVKVQRQVAEVEARYKVKQAQDSMQLARKEGVVLKEKVRQRSMIVVFSFILLLALSGILMLAIKSRKRANLEKKRALEDELLIKHLRDELDHRVDNTLNNISAIIRMVKDKSSDSRSFAMLEQKIDPLITLYKILKENQSGNILVQDYFEQLCGGLKAFYDHHNRVEIVVNANVEMPGNKAGRIGLILNELVTNSFKHAFAENSEGQIRVSCEQGDDGQYFMSVADSGNGMAVNIPGENRRGLRLVKLLAHELQAKIIEKKKEGVEFEFYFF